MTLRSYRRTEHCEHCGQEIVGLKLGTGGGRYYDAEPVTVDSENAVYELVEREVAGQTVASMALHDRSTARRLRQEGVGLYREHGCDRRQPVAPGPHTPWTTA